MIDKEWFLRKLGEVEISMRELARRVEWDVGQISRLLNGKRKAKIADVRPLATALGAPEHEVAVALGLRNSHTDVPVSMTLAPLGTVVDFDWHETLKSPSAVKGSDGVRILSAGGQLLDIVNGWTLIAAPEEEAGGKPPIEELCLLELKDGRRVVGRVRRIFDGGVASIMALSGSGLESVISHVTRWRRISTILP